MTFPKRLRWMGLVLPIFLTAVSGCRVDTGLDKSKISSQLTQLVSSGKFAEIKELQPQPSATPDPSIQLDADGKPTQQFQTSYAILSMSVDSGGTLHMVRASDSGPFGPTGPTEYVISTDGGKTVAVKRQGTDYLKDLWATNPKEHIINDLKVVGSNLYVIAYDSRDIVCKLSIADISGRPSDLIPIPSDLQTPEPIPNFIPRRLLRLAMLYNSKYPAVLTGSTLALGAGAGAGVGYQAVTSKIWYDIERPTPTSWKLVRKVGNGDDMLLSLDYSTETQKFSCQGAPLDVFEITMGTVKRTIKRSDYRSCFIDSRGRLYLFSKLTGPNRGFAVIDLNRPF